MSFKPQRTFNGTQGNPSIDTMGPEQLSHDIDELCKMFDPNSIHGDGSQGGISTSNINMSGFNINDIGGVASSVIIALRNNSSNGNLEYSLDGENWVAAFPRESNYLQLSGGVMSGDLDMGANAISNLKTPALDGDAVNKSYADWVKTTLEAALALKAPITDPTFAGVPKAPTADSTVNNTQIASTAFVQNLISALASNVYTKAESDGKYESIAAVNSLVSSVTYNNSTGTFTITKQDGSYMTIDTNIEKIPASVSIVQSGSVYKLRITNDDGTYTECDVSDMFNEITFSNTGEIEFTVQTNADGSKTVSADIAVGAIPSSKLDPDFVSEVESLVAQAEDAADAADDAKDNAQLYSQSASTASTSASTSASNASTYANSAYGYKVQAESAASNANVAAANASTFATTSANFAKDSEAAACGTRDGVPVSSADEFYHNNAKYYKEQAQAIAGLTIDDAVSDTSHNPIENQAITNYVNSKNTAKLYTGTCSDLPAETAKTVTLDNGAGFALEDGVKILVRFVNGNKASATLNVNATGAVALKRRNVDTLTLYTGASATGIALGESVLLTYYAGITPAWMLSSGTASALLYLNRNGRVNDADTLYTTYMARGEALNSSDTNPTANGCISWTYE